MYPDQLDRQPVQRHWLVLLVGGHVEEEKVLLVSGLLVKKGMIPHGSATLDEEEKMVLSSGALVATWCSWGLFSWLGWAGGHRHLFGQFCSSPISQFVVASTKIS